MGRCRAVWAEGVTPSAGLDELVSSVVDFFGYAFEGLAILLLVHDAASLGVALRPVTLWGLELCAIVYRSAPEPAASVLCHIASFVSSRQGFGSLSRRPWRFLNRMVSSIRPNVWICDGARKGNGNSSELRPMPPFFMTRHVRVSMRVPPTF